MPTTTLSGDSRIDALLSTWQWGDSNGTSINLTYSFPTIGSTWVSDYFSDKPLSASFLNTTQQQDVRDALQSWSNVANIRFTEVFEPEVQGDIRFTFSESFSENTLGAAFFPPSSSFVSEEPGDIWLNAEKSSDLSFGTKGYDTLLHELGHALGLKHSFESMGNNSSTLSNLESTSQFTIMANNANDNYDGAGWVRNGDTDFFSKVSNTTPMLLDMAAMQFLYGANTSYNTEDNTYTFSNTTSEIKTIWDAGGIDTFDLSNHHLDLTIHLTPSVHSSIGIVNYELVNGFIEETTKAPDGNIVIARDVEIENAIGGSGRDIIIGNSLDNSIKGSEGHDFLHGGSGNDWLFGEPGDDKLFGESGDDIINGGEGNDEATFEGIFSEASITYEQNLDSFLITTPSGGTDTVVDVEQFIFDDKSIAIADLRIIIDDGNPTTTPTMPVLSIGDITITEGPGTQIATFVISMDSTTTETINGSFEAIEDSAKANSDFQTNTGTFSIAPGKTSTTISINILDDLVVEDTETFQIKLSNVSNAQLIDGKDTILATGEILDTDNLTVGNRSHSPDANLVNIQRGVVSSASGDDTYILSSAVIDPNAQITISDNQGTNKIQLFEGLNIINSIVASDTILLSLNNGAEITVLNASAFAFELSGNPLAGTLGISNNYTQFVSDILRSTIPETGSILNDDNPIIINADGSTTSGVISNPFNGEPANSDSNLINVQRGVVSSASGDDTYVLSSSVVDSNARITISDNQGSNKIQLFAGLSIASTIVATDTAQLTLSNGAEITMLGASSFTYETGGNPLAGTSGITNNYSQFVSDILGTTAPQTGNVPNNGSSITINPDGTSVPLISEFTPSSLESPIGSVATVTDENEIVITQGTSIIENLL